MCVKPRLAHPLLGPAFSWPKRTRPLRKREKIQLVPVREKERREIQTNEDGWD